MKWICVLAALALSGQEIPREIPPVAGKVVSSGRPVAGAQVEWRSGETVRSTVTGEDGSFCVPAGPEAGRLNVRMFGFAPAAIEIPAGPERRDIVVELAVNGVIERQPPAAPQRTDLQEAPAAALPQDEDASLLIQGSISRGLSEQAAEPDAMALFLRGGLGPLSPAGMPEMGGGPGAGPEGASGGLAQAMSGAPAAMAGGGRGGMRGPGGPGGMGGPGGVMGPPGMGGPGGRGVPGGPGAFDPRRAREMVANMSPEEREKFRRALQQRLSRTNQREGFGNRRQSRRQEIRGMGFFTLRDSALDATPFSVNGRAVEKPDYWQTRFGGSIGGGITQRSFFFVNYNGVRGSDPWSGFATVPNDALRGGNFAGTNVIFDPLSGAPFAGNVIPDSRISSIAKGLNELIPLPNAIGSIQNYKFITTIPSISDMFNARFNQTLARRNRLAVNFNLNRRRSESPQLFGWVDESSGRGYNFDVSWSQSLSTRLIHQARVRYNFNGNRALPYFAYGRDWSGELGIQGNSRDPINYGPPNLNFTNLGDLTDGGHSDRRNMSYIFSDSWIIVRGRHSLSAGFEFTRTQWNNFAETDARGTLFFGGLVTSGFDANRQPLPRTGVDYADFLLGATQQSTLRYGGADTYLRGSHYGVFAQDEFRVSKALTLSLGVRYDQWRPYSEKYLRMANVAWSLSPPSAVVVTPASGASEALVSADTNNIAPRLAFAWRPYARKPLIVRGGYSIFYDSTAITRIPTRLASQPPFATASTFNTSAENLLTLARPFFGPQDVTIRNTLAVNPRYPLPYAQTWSFSLQYTLGGFVIETNYMGTKGTRLMLQRIPNRAAPGSPADSENRRPIENAIGFTYETPEGNAIYHAGQVRVVRRQRRGVGWNALYTWSKSIDNASTIGGSGNVVVQNDNDFSAERGLSSFDIRHAASIEGVLTSPFGRQGVWLREKSLLATTLADWTATFSLTMRTGNPLTARVSGNAADAGGTGATGSARADATGLPIDAGKGYFNTLAFKVPAGGSYGNAGRNTIPGPGFFLLNAGIGRSIQIGDDSRRRLEARLEASNVLNHPNITGIGTTVNAVNYGLATRAGNMRSMSLQLRFRF